MNTIVSQPTEHCHGPDLDKAPFLLLRTELKARAADTEELPSHILHSAMTSFPLDSAHHLPNQQTLLRTIRRQRQPEITGVNGRTSDHLRRTDRGENFVLHKIGDLAIISTASNRSVLKACKHWFADGTFKVSNTCCLTSTWNVNCRCVRTIIISCSHFMACSSRR
jgi:hypothetical protein